MKGYHKVPLRDVYCEGWRCWLAETIYCLVVLKIMPNFNGKAKDSGMPITN